MNSGKNKILLIIIGFLLITNIAMLIFFVLPSENEQRRHHHNSFADALKEKVQFTDSQFVQYQQRRQVQKKINREQFRKLRNAKEDFFSLLNFPGASDSLIQSKADSIGLQQKKLDLSMYKYFQDLRKIATHQQLNAFDTAAQKALHRMIGPPEKKDKDKKDQKKK